MRLLCVLLVIVGVTGGVSAQYPNYFIPQTYSYPNFQYTSGLTFPQYSTGGAQFGLPQYSTGGAQFGLPQYSTGGAQYGFPMQMQIQQPFYGASPSLTGMPLMNGGMDGSTVMSAQSTTAIMPNQGVAMLASPAIGQAVISPQQIYQPGAVVSSVPVVTQQVPGTSVVQSNTVEVVEEPPMQPPKHFDYYSYGRDGLGGADKEGRGIPRRPSYYQGPPPSYIRNGSPIKVTKPEHFEYVGYGRSEDQMVPYTP